MAGEEANKTYYPPRESTLRLLIVETVELNYNMLGVLCKTQYSDGWVRFWSLCFLFRTMNAA